jgi:hypothetical protein
LPSADVARLWWGRTATERGMVFVRGDRDPLYRRLRASYTAKLRKLESAARIVDIPPFVPSTNAYTVNGQSNVGVLIDDAGPL